MLRKGDGGGCRGIRNAEPDRFGVDEGSSGVVERHGELGHGSACGALYGVDRRGKGGGADGGGIAGVSVGDELEYADEVTLGRSIINRIPFESSIKI